MNDGTGSSGRGTISTSVTGNHFAYAAWEGDYITKYAGERCGISLSGGRVLVTQTGMHAASFMRSGVFTITGGPDFFYGLTGMDDISDFSKRSSVIGPNFGSGYSGGTIMMPKGVYEETFGKNHFERDFISSFMPSPLRSVDTNVLKSQLHLSARLNPNDIFSKCLSDLDNAELARRFIKFIPRV